jgi:selenide,water dikinase
LGPGALEKVLSRLPKFSDSDLLVGFDTSDDAAVYRVTPDVALIQTIDFFPPVVDDPYIFGQIAAANALSDVYAMGGAPRLAMNLLCVPSCLPEDIIQGILEGGCSKVMEAGATLCGGHTIEDEEPKYGLCVTGFIHPDHVLANSAAREGDLLILSKPLGTGILTTAAKAELLSPEDEKRMIDAMTMLNKGAQQAMAQAGGVHACTDVTGFGLMGHAGEMAAGSGKTIEIFADQVPVFEAALELARDGIIPGGAYRNMGYLQDRVRIGGNVPQERSDVLFDPQTSGGLLMAVEPGKAQELLQRLQDCCPQARIVGQVLSKGEADLLVR